MLLYIVLYKFNHNAGGIKKLVLTLFYQWLLLYIAVYSRANYDHIICRRGENKQNVWALVFSHEA